MFLLDVYDVDFTLGVMKSRALLAAVLLLPNLAFAEVSDKMPSVPEIVGFGFLVAALLFAVSRFRWWLAIVGLLVSAFLIAGTVELWRETPMREALLLEQGPIYFVALASADLMALMASVLGAVVSWRKGHGMRSQVQ